MAQRVTPGLVSGRRKKVATIVTEVPQRTEFLLHPPTSCGSRDTNKLRAVETIDFDIGITQAFKCAPGPKEIKQSISDARGKWF